MNKLIHSLVFTLLFLVSTITMSSICNYLSKDEDIPFQEGKSLNIAIPDTKIPNDQDIPFNPKAKTKEIETVDKRFRPFSPTSTQKTSANGGKGGDAGFISLGYWGSDLSNPYGVAVNSTDYLYVTDTNHNSIKVFDPITGEVINQFGNTILNHPQGVAINGSGYCYVASTNDGLIQVFTSTGVWVISWDGSETGGNSFQNPRNLIVHPTTGDVFVLDYPSDGRIQQFTASGTFIRIFPEGNPGTFGDKYDLTFGLNYETIQVLHDDGKVMSVSPITGEIINFGIEKLPPSESADRIFTDQSRNLTYISDWGSESITVCNFTGGLVNNSVIGEGILNYPEGLAANDTMLFVADSLNHQVKIFNQSDILVQTIGTGIQGTGNAQFNTPVGLTVNNTGYIFVADHDNHRIQVFDSTGAYVNTIGTSGIHGNGNGEFYCPGDVAVNDSGYIYVADRYNDRIQIFYSNLTYLDQWGISGTGNGEFDNPNGVAINSTGHIFVSDFFNHRVQVFDANGVFITKWGAFDGDGSVGTGNGEFNQPQGIAIDDEGYIWVTDRINSRIQVFDCNGVFIKKWGTPGAVTPIPPDDFNNAPGIAISGSKVFATDNGRSRILSFNQTGLTSLGSYGSISKFDNPTGMATSRDGSILYIADSLNDRISLYHIGFYEEHSSISIDGNPQFMLTATNENWKGDGSVNNPFVIEGYNITGAASESIHISNTDYYVIITNCFITGGTRGIYLYNANNTVINGNFVSDTSIQGILTFFHLENVNITNNYIFDINSIGISYCQVDKGTIANNRVVNTDAQGIQVHTCTYSNVVVSNNSVVLVDTTFTAIDVTSSEGVTVIENIVINNTGDGIRVSNSDLCIIHDNILRKNRKGISIEQNSNYNLIIGNTISENNEDGINVWDTSRYNNISNNLIELNLHSGIFIDWYSSNNTIEGNEITYNSDNGIAFGELGNNDNTTIEKNIINFNNKHGISFKFQTNNSFVINNTIYRNLASGILLNKSCHNIIKYNAIYDHLDNSSFSSGRGLYITYNSSENEIANNTIFNNQVEGIFIWNCELNLVQYNNLIANNLHGSSQANDSNDGSIFLSNTFQDNYWDDWESGSYQIAGTISNTDPTPSNDIYESSVHLMSSPMMIFPLGGETLNQTITIQWETSSDTQGHNITYDLWYSTNGGINWTSLSTDIATTSYDINTTEFIDGEYQLKVIANCSEGLMTEDSTENFTIYHSPPHTLIGLGITNPSGGESLSDEFNVTWTHAIDSLGYVVTYSVELRVSLAGPWNVLTSITTENWFTINTSKWIDSNQCEIRVNASSSGLRISDNSNQFTIIVHAISEFEILNPLAGIMITDYYNVTWNAATDTRGHAVIYDFEFRLNPGEAWTRLAAGIDVTWYSFDTTSWHDSTECQIQIIARCSENAGVFRTSISAIFTVNNSIFIIPEQFVSITFLFPAEGDILNGTVIVSWTVNLTSIELTYLIEYSIDGGITWNDLATTVSNDSPVNYSWDTIQYIDSRFYRLRVNVTSTGVTGTRTSDIFAVDNDDSYDLIIGTSIFDISPNIAITINVNAVVNVSVKQVDTAPLTPSTLDPLGIYLEITLSDESVLTELWINISFAELGAGQDPENVRLYYYDDEAKQWKQMLKTGVDYDREVIWGYSDHVTVFGVMDEHAETPTDDNWLFIITITVILLLVVCGGVLILYTRVKKPQQLECQTKGRIQKKI